jgi:diguanylate cyclase (GGDEF)-like protein
MSNGKRRSIMGESARRLEAAGQAKPDDDGGGSGPCCAELERLKRRFASAVARNGVLRRRLRELERYRRLAFTDALTGVRNRLYFDTRAAEEVSRARRDGTQLSLVLVDVDDLKPLNDSRGHQAGDRALRRLGKALREEVRAHDVVCRVGDDEFAVLMPGAGPRDALRLAGRLRQRRWLPEGAGPALRVSAGTSTLSPLACTPQALFARADAALYRDKDRRQAKDPRPGNRRREGPLKLTPSTVVPLPRS